MFTCGRLRYLSELTVCLEKAVLKFTPVQISLMSKIHKIDMRIINLPFVKLFFVFSSLSLFLYKVLLICFTS